MINIADIHDCFGCGVCAKACPKQIIALNLNKNGFYEPRIESTDQCIKWLDLRRGLRFCGR